MTYKIVRVSNDAFLLPAPEEGTSAWDPPPGTPEFAARTTELMNQLRSFVESSLTNRSIPSKETP